MGRILGAPSPFLDRGAGSPSNAKSPGPRLTSIPSGILIHPAIWPQKNMGRKLGAVPLWGGGAGSPSNSVARAEAYLYLHAKFHLDPSNRLPQCINVTDRQDRQTNCRQTDRRNNKKYMQRSDSIGPTVLQTVAQKCALRPMPHLRQSRATLTRDKGWRVKVAKCGHASLCVCMCICLVCLCPRPYAHTTARTRM